MKHRGVDGRTRLFEPNTTIMNKLSHKLIVKIPM